MDIKFKIEENAGILYLKDFSLYSKFLISDEFIKRWASFKKFVISPKDLLKDEWYDLSNIMEIPKVNIDECYYLLPYFINVYITEKLYFENPWYVQMEKIGKDTIDVYMSKMPTNRICEYRVIYNKLKNKVELS